MKQLRVKGLVVSVSDFGDWDRIITLITEEKGKMSVTVKGGKSVRSKFLSADVFSYGTFDLKRTGKYFYLFDCDVSEDFYDLRGSIEKLALASYICEVASALTPEGTGDAPLLSLTLNSLFALCYKDAPLCLVKGAFEFKTAVLSGYMPALDACGVCGVTEGEVSYIDTRNGRLICSDCLALNGEKNGLDSVSILLPVSSAVREALIYLSKCPVNRFLSFRLDESLNGEFSNTCEKYLINHLEREFATLSFYKMLV